MDYSTHTKGFAEVGFLSLIDSGTVSVQNP